MALKQISLINKNIQTWADNYKKGKYTSDYGNGKTYDNYENLYKDIVQYGEPYLRTFVIQPLIEAALVEGDFKNHYRKIFTNFSNFNWVYIESYKQDYHSVFERIKVYISPNKETASTIFLKILNDLWHLDLDFCAKLALVERDDRIILWVLPQDLEIVMEKVLTICKKSLLPPPLFLPQYKGLGISRELDISYNEFIAKTLFEFIRLPMSEKHHTSDLNGFIDFLDSKPKVVEPYSNFDKTIALISLNLIKDNISPLHPQLGLVHIKKVDTDYDE
jgi:hypothetical protein